MSVRERIRRLEGDAAALQASGRYLRPEPQELLSWYEEVSPTFNWRWRHLALVRGELERVTRGESKRLLISFPPRHCKSETVTVRYPAYRLEIDPTLRVIVGAYNATLAEKFSRKTRRICKARIRMSAERTAAQDWETSAGGGLRAVGVGGGITGQGGDLIVVDDPVKSREEANSEAYRERCWEWWCDDLRTRLEPGGAIILIMTRWHEDDLAGRILASEGAHEWAMIDLPALAETQHERDKWAEKLGRSLGLPDPLGRAPGEPLCPARFDVPALEALRRDLGRSFYALYQGRPQPIEGLMFQRPWFKLLDVGPREGHLVRYWDKAGTAGAGANTCGVLMLRSKAGLYIVLDCVVAQVEAPEREALILQTAQLDALAWGGRVQTFVEQEPGSGGKESAQGTVRNLAGFRVEADRVTGDKILRAEPWAAQCKAGNVYVVKAAWTGAYIEEHCAFPSGKRKDRVDASSGAFAKLALGFRSWSVYG